MTHEYPEPDEEEGYLYVREMGDDELLTEYRHLLGVLEAMAGEVEFRLESDRSPITEETIPGRPYDVDQLLVALDHAKK
jgi:hypothetical protein